MCNQMSPLLLSSDNGEELRKVKCLVIAVPVQSLRWCRTYVCLYDSGKAIAWIPILGMSMDQNASEMKAQLIVRLLCYKYE